MEHIKKAMDEKIYRLTVDNPFDSNEVERKNPFGFRLVPAEVWKGSKFERSFVTTLGQGIFEQVAKIIAEGSGAFAENQHQRDIKINTFQRDTIDNIVAEQRRSKGRGKTVSPDLHSELEQLRNLSIPSQVPISTISDLYIRRSNGDEEFYSFKTVKPNLDQSAEAKRVLLSLRTANDQFSSYFALPYNPAGEGESYIKAKHTYPRRLFDMDDRDFVLIGSSLWNKIGDDFNTFEELLDIFSEAGQISSERIRREYFGTE